MVPALKNARFAHPRLDAQEYVHRKSETSRRRYACARSFLRARPAPPGSGRSPARKATPEAIATGWYSRLEPFGTLLHGAPSPFLRNAASHP